MRQARPYSARYGTIRFSSLSLSFYERSTVGRDPRDRSLWKNFTLAPEARFLGRATLRMSWSLDSRLERSNRDIESKGGGELWRRYVKESRGGISRKNRENLPYYKSINLYLLELFLKRLKFKSWELSLRVQIPLRNSQLCTFIMLIIIIILAMIKYIFLKSTFRNYWNIITCF